MHEDIDFCRKRIADEERLGSGASTPEAGEAHFQLAMLYKAQLATLLRSAGRLQAA